MYRTHNLNELRVNDEKKEVVLCGWVNKIRNLGSFAFIDLRDRYGITQIVLKDSMVDMIKDIKLEYVIKVEGTVEKRTSVNNNINTGDIEVNAKNIEILSKSDTLPFDINADNVKNENLRFTYRYLDLRSERMKRNIIARNKMMFSIREFMQNEGFLDIDTPILAKSTPEGARDFIVPSRLHKGDFYALPQSPQLFKQTLMIAGFDKYYQFAKCFRDEDLRADRQLEFIQLDLEMSFIHQNDIMNLCEKLVKKVFFDLTGIEKNEKFPIMTYDDAMKFYGSDKPDTRFDMKLIDIKEEVSNVGIGFFDSSEYISSIVVPKILSRKDVQVYEEFVKTYHKASGLAFIKKENNTLSSSLLKFFSEDKLKSLEEKLNIKDNETALIISGKKNIVLNALGALRLKIANDLNLIDENLFNFLWVVDFPMFEFSEEENRFVACHHPFTNIKEEYINDLKEDKLENIKAEAYDIVLNGFEIGGGSIRIHNSELQALVFDKLKISKEEQMEKFGFLLQALKYGVPPHGGLAFGFERWLMVMLKESSIKEVIPFPKTNKGQDLLTGAPASVEISQLEEELHLKKIIDKE